MILRRLGNKAKIAREIQKYFPPHRIYIEPFFGAGGMFFNKQKAQYNIVNDIDSDVYNLFQVVMRQKDELRAAFEKMPIHSDLLEYWKHHQETEPILKALRFCFLSNFTLYGRQYTMRNGAENPKERLLENLDKCFEGIRNVQFYNKSFSKFLSCIRDTAKPEGFIYCDPPYIGTTHTYSHSFTEQDSIELFDCLEGSGVKWAMSEFNNPFILAQAKERGLFVAKIAERQNLKNRRLEILVTNYKPQITLFN